MDGPDLRSPETRGQPLRRSRGRAARARGRRPVHFAAHRRRRAFPADPSRETREGASAASASRYAASCVEVVVGLAGKADDDVRADRGVGNARADVDRRAPRSARSCTAGASPRACGRSRAAAADGSAARSASSRATRSTISRRAVHRLERADAEEHVALASRSATSARSSSISDDGGVEVAAVRAEVHAGQRDFLEAAAATRSTSRSTSSTGTLRGAPRVVGMMQYEHGSAQPVCTRSVNAVRPATPGSIARAAAAVAVAEPFGGRRSRRLGAATQAIAACRRSARRERRSAAPRLRPGARVA